MNPQPESPVEVVADEPEIPPASFYQKARSAFRWALAGTYFFIFCPLLILLTFIRDPKKHDGSQRWLCRNIVRLAGARVEAKRYPGFDPHRTCFFVSNHVNLFDPFVLYNVTPQIIRGLELESHFRIPVYGQLMRHFGNVPVPDSNRPSELKRMWRLTRATLDSGISLAVFPEASRTITGRLGPFYDGVFRMALQFGVPITPVSIVGSFEFQRKTHWLLRPGRIVVHLHDTIDVRQFSRHDVEKLRDRVWETVNAPIEEHMAAKELAEKNL